jgi:hypothetical protein
MSLALAENLLALAEEANKYPGTLNREAQGETAN